MMESTKPAETTPRLSINIHASCNNIMVSGEHAAVTIHMSRQEAPESEEPESLGDVRIESERRL
jgi:hypothetical protein